MQSYCRIDQARARYALPVVQEQGCVRFRARSRLPAPTDGCRELPSDAVRCDGTLTAAQVPCIPAESRDRVVGWVMIRDAWVLNMRWGLGNAPGALSPRLPSRRASRFLLTRRQVYPQSHKPAVSRDLRSHASARDGPITAGLCPGGSPTLGSVPALAALARTPGAAAPAGAETAAQAGRNADCDRMGELTADSGDGGGGGGGGGGCSLCSIRPFTPHSVTVRGVMSGTAIKARKRRPRIKQPLSRRAGRTGGRLRQCDTWPATSSIASRSPLGHRRLALALLAVRSDAA
jgi:hypothetical protein